MTGTNRESSLSVHRALMFNCKRVVAVKDTNLSKTQQNSKELRAAGCNPHE
jgi:hypothetical protein